jgi:hypothetical protein
MPANPLFSIREDLRPLAVKKKSMKTNKPFKTTNRGVIDFINYAAPWLQVNGPDTRAGYAVKRMLDRATALYQRYQETQEDLNIDNCITEAGTGKILREADGKYQFTKEGLKKLNADVRALLAREVEIEPYYATEAPKKGWSQADKDAFAGFVLKSSTS